MDKACSFGSFSSLFDWINIQVYGLCDELVAVAFLSRLICSSPGQSLMALCGNVNAEKLQKLQGEGGWRLPVAGWTGLEVMP